ncbi:hypothetical protein AGMMS50256_30250 [Betaproteobacteria bacterium]|nr:hypothetical protein AGMMS50256_30250 [Betaproteobacteria bacterium]
MKQLMKVLSAVALGLFLLPGMLRAQQTLMFSQAEIRDPQLSNAVAARIAVPQGWAFKEQQATWNANTYADPARVVYVLQGPADEVEFASVSQIQYGFNQATLAIMDAMLNMMTGQVAQLCQQTQQMPGAQPVCAQAQAENQRTTQQARQQRAAYVSGQTVDGGMISMQPMWAADFAQWLLRQNREITGIQVKKIEKPRDLMALLGKAVAEVEPQLRQMAAQMNAPLKGISFDVARVEYGYAKGGRRYDGMTLVITQYTTFINNQRMPAGGPDPGYGKEIISWNARVSAASALEGRLRAHEAEITAIAANSAVDPLWQATVEKLAADTSQKINAARSEQQRKMLESEMKHQQKMQQMRQESFDYVNRTRQEVFARRSESLSRASAGWTDAITDRQVWDSGGGKVVLPNDYKYAWQGAGGKIVGSNNPSFNPNRSSDYSGDWQEMSKSSRFD